MPNNVAPGMGYHRSPELCRVVRSMTEIELSEQIETLLTNQPNPEKPNRIHNGSRKEIGSRKNDRLLRIVRRHYIPHAGYVDRDFDGETLLHSGKYIKYPKNSNCQRWMKRLTSKKARRCSELTGKGNQYRRLFDYWWTLY